jgi:hypothetical protein
VGTEAKKEKTISANYQTIRALIIQTLENINQELPERERFTVDDSIALYGDAAVLDSLAVVSFIEDLEIALEREFGTTVSLLTELSGNAQAVFASIDTLTTHIASRLAA